jgi:hypothetical protein
MANTQIHITENGTKTLATAGKYCDRNIDVNVAVPGKATQFTNYYKPEYVTLDYKVQVVSNEVTKIANAEVNLLKIPYHHAPGEVVQLRMRGIGSVRSNLVVVLYAEDGETRVNHFYTSNCAITYDSYGDAVMTFQAGTVTSMEWHYMELNFQYDFAASGTEALTGPIVTINEPIGNGGCAQ